MRDTRRTRIDRPVQLPKHRDHDCTCFACKNGWDALEKWQNDCMARAGFYMHFVPFGRYLNAHTHGFDKTWKHPDFQMVMPLGEGIMSGIFWNFANRVKDGETFKSGDNVDKIIGGGHKVRLMEAKEAGRSVLRVLLPDPEWRFPGDPGVLNEYARQVTVDTDKEPMEN